MKKVRLIVTIITIILLILMVVGITILIANNRLDFLDTSYEIIAFSIGIAGILLSVVTQIDAYRQEHIVSRLKAELDLLGKEANLQIRTERHIEHQLETIENQITKKSPHKK